MRVILLWISQLSLSGGYTQNPLRVSDPGTLPGSPLASCHVDTQTRARRIARMPRGTLQYTRNVSEVGHESFAPYSLLQRRPVRCVRHPARVLAWVVSSCGSSELRDCPRLGWAFACSRRD